MTDARTESRWDHARDLRKHDFDPPELTFTHRRTVAALVGYCEGICSSGALAEPAELQLRKLVAETLAAFNMPSVAEQGPA